MVYRECSEDDFSRVVGLLKQLWPDKDLDESAIRFVFEKGIRADNQYFLCAEEGGNLIGFCSLVVKNNLWQQGNLGHIDEIIVDAAFRGKGVGAALLNEITAIAGRMNCKRIELDSAHHRTAAHRFYHRHGFDNRAVLFSKELNK